jgi:hypothetical protein
MSRPVYKRRDILVAFAFGLTIAIGFNVWFNLVTTPENIDSYLWLSRLQEPGRESGLWVGRTLYPVIGNPWSLRIAIVVAYAVLVGMWTLVSLAIAILVRLTASLLRARRAAHE